MWALDIVYADQLRIMLVPTLLEARVGGLGPEFTLDRLQEKLAQVVRIALSEGAVIPVMSREEAHARASGHAAEEAALCQQTGLPLPPPVVSCRAFQVEVDFQR